MEISLNTPALLFPAISLLLLAYTNRFLALAALIRNLYSQYKSEPEEHIIGQLHNLRYRLSLIRYMQALGVSSIWGCVFCMFLLFQGWKEAGKIVFGCSLILLLISLALSVREIQVSVNALNLQLSDMEFEYAQRDRAQLAHTRRRK